MPAYGLRNRRRSAANSRGRPPSRPIANKVRAVRFTPASAATKASITTMMSTSVANQCPTYRVARVSRAVGPGGGPLAAPATLAPKPTAWVQAANTK